MPRSVIDTMNKATAELESDRGRLSVAKTIGDTAPVFTLKDPDGHDVSSIELLSKRAADRQLLSRRMVPVLQYDLQASSSRRRCRNSRSFWCEHCCDFSADRAEQPQVDTREQAFLIPIWTRRDLSAKHSVSSSSCPTHLVDLYKSLKNDLPSFNDDAEWTLPMPARYVIALRRNHHLRRSKSRLHPTA